MKIWATEIQQEWSALLIFKCYGGHKHMVKQDSFIKITIFSEDAAEACSNWE